MTDSDYESKLDEMERSNLQKVISEVETALTVSTPGTRPVLEVFLQNAKSRVAALDKKIKESQEQREIHEREQASVAYLAQKEAALSESERKTYSGFLEKPFFTKNDFGSLEQFYAHTWDRLSESGKDQMSHRVWEGIRHNEYTFTELPKVVQEKEIDRAYKRLTEPQLSEDVSRIPVADRTDFVRAFENGRHDEASQVLDRRSFRENLFLGNASRSTEIESPTARKTIAQGMQAGDSDPKLKELKSSADTQADLSIDSVDFRESGAAAKHASVSPADIPNVGGSEKYR